MKCPYCGNHDTRVIDSRAQNEGNSIKRRRECEKCLKRFNTSEKIYNLPIYIIKTNGEIEEYDRNKVYQGIVRSLVKRNYDNSKIDVLIDDIERDILTNYNGKIESSKLGDIIMENLFYLDEVAYVRFASVYNKFDNLDSFLKVIKEIKKKKKESKK
ncbi:transcriptional regulator NrdR [Pseudostreptobacillus hongkongensis]|uniref:transcriptional regulator NrdR n=1 Tax=Pseudostreptobacillus hongkongensis TaxID=1162717 RepID=UPI0028D55E90|nr:transcriptional regulator NrdR [Pseudostreptobacillus hongkongensis]